MIRPGDDTTIYYHPELYATVAVEVNSDTPSGDCPAGVPALPYDPAVRINALSFEIGCFRTRGVLTDHDAFLKGAKAEISSKQSGGQRDRSPLHRTVNASR